MERRVFGDGERAPGSASSLQQRPQTRSASGSTFMELAGLEPATSWVRSGRSPCARFVFRCPDDAHSHRSWLAHSDTWTALTGELTGELGQESLQIDFQGGLENRRNSSAAIKGAGAAQVEQAAKNATTPGSSSPQGTTRTSVVATCAVVSATNSGVAPTLARSLHIDQLSPANRRFGQQPSNPRAQVRLLPGPSRLFMRNPRTLDL
jgi:hypothetical protein